MQKPLIIFCAVVLYNYIPGMNPLWSFSMIAIVTLLISVWVEVISGSDQTSYPKMVESFREGWEKRWKEKTFMFKSRNHFQIVQESDNPVLKMESERSASGLVREMKIEPLTSGRISWRWKVEKCLAANTDERLKKGDDYAARLFIIFETHFLSWKTRSVCYVWAGNETVGSIYKNPYSKSVATVVLQSGDQHAGRWITEDRDFVADYRRYFRKEPARLSGVAIMVDTDNTGSRATAWFDDIVLE